MNALPRMLGVGRFDPRVSLVVATAVVIASITTVHGIPAMLGVLAFASGWHGFAARRAGATARVLSRVTPFAAMVIVLNAVLVPGEALVSVAGRRVVSREGLEDGVFFALRLGVMLMTVSALLAGSAPEAMARGVHDVVRRVSQSAAKHVALFVFLAMGFVPLFADEFHRIRMAQSFRGGDFSGGLGRRAGAARSWLLPLILSAVHRADQLALAVELRDVRNRLPRTIEPPRAGAADLGLLVAGAAVLVAASWGR